MLEIYHKFENPAFAGTVPIPPQLQNDIITLFTFLHRLQFCIQRAKKSIGTLKTEPRKMVADFIKAKLELEVMLVYSRSDCTASFNKPCIYEIAQTCLGMAAPHACVHTHATSFFGVSSSGALIYRPLGPIQPIPA